MKVLKFNKDDEMNEIEISCKNSKMIKKKLEVNTNEKGFNELDCVYTWNLEDIEIKCFGYTEGDDSLKNNHNLPIENDSKFHLYGCLFLVAFYNNKIRDLHISEYALLSYGYDEIDDINDDLDHNIDDLDHLDHNLEIDDDINDDLNHNIDDNNDNDNDNDDSQLKLNSDYSSELEIDTHNY